MSNILMAGFKSRLKYSILITSVLMICVAFIAIVNGNYTDEPFYQKKLPALLFLFLFVFAVLNIVCDLFTERHLGVKRLIVALAVLSSAVVPALYLNKAHYVDEGLAWALVLISPLCVAAVLLYGRRLILWIQEGFQIPK